MSRILNLKVIVGLATLAGAILLGLQLSTAGDISPEQLLLKLSDLPSGSSIQIQSPLIPGSADNGMVDKDGTDIVQGYIAGARVDFMVPLVKMEGMPEDQAMAQAYVAHLVYRFANERAAANEFQRLVAVMKSQPNGMLESRNSSPSPSVVFEVKDNEVTFATHRWFFMQRGKFLVILSMPGPMQALASDIGQNYGYQLTQKAIEDFNRATDTLFTTNVSLLESR